MADLFDLTGRVAMVTGASRGLGQHFARVLAAGRRRSGHHQPHRRLARSASPRTDGARPPRGRVELDVREHESIQRAIAEAMRHFGRIDILVNNAGCNIRKPAADVTWDDWNEILDTNLRGAFFVAQAVARQMIPRRDGRIINIGSVTCVAGYAGLGPYGASRGGIKQMTMSLAHDWGQHGITVNCLAPGWFKTAQNRALYDDPAGSNTSASGSRSADRASRTTSTALCCCWPPTPAATLLAKPCSSTAASRSAPASTAQLVQGIHRGLDTDRHETTVGLSGPVDPSRSTHSGNHSMIAHFATCLAILMSFIGVPFFRP